MRIPIIAFTLCALAISSIGGAFPAAAEQRSERPRSASGPQFQQEMLEQWRAGASRKTLVAAGDYDFAHVAVLEDDGTLVRQPNNTTIYSSIASRFYATHADDFDYLCIFTSSMFANNVEPESGFAYAVNVSNPVQGINFPMFNDGMYYGVNRLRSIVNMNDLGEYGEDPSEPLPAFVNSFTGIEILAQEAAHMVGSFTPSASHDILGRSNAHWSFFFHNGGSVMEGNAWFDHGDGTFTSLGGRPGYSQLDLYHLGLLLPSEVIEPMFVIQNPVPDLAEYGSDWAPPTAGVTVAGTPAYVTIDDIVAANGPRIPDAQSSQRIFAMAFILVVPEGQQPQPHDLAKVDEFRVQWSQWFAQQTGGRGTMNTELSTLPVSADFHVRAAVGAPGQLVSFDNDSYGSIQQYQWSFGDGKSSTLRHPRHRYSHAGTYDVTLTVSGPGGTHSTTKQAVVRMGTKAMLFEDDFETDRGWLRDTQDTATSGRWVRANPVGTAITSEIVSSPIYAPVQPEYDHSAMGTICLVTGNTATGGAVGENDVDGGVAGIVSPSIDLSGALDPSLSFWSWFSNNAGAQPGSDFMTVDVSSDDGATWKNALTIHSSHHRWRHEQIRLSQFSDLTSTMRVRFRARDENGASLVEAAVDDVEIFDVITPTAVTTPVSTSLLLEKNYPNPFAGGTTIRFALPVAGQVALNVYDVRGQRVRSLTDGHLEPGPRTVRWDGRDDAGRAVAVGTYFYRLDTDQGSITRKMSLLK